MSEMSPEEMAKAQQANCIFCKIIAGEIPSKKVYEDQHTIAILDINPAARGHVLVMPKEHYPILPLIPFPTMQHIFAKTQSIAQAIKDALLVPSATIFIANGAVAGQQSPHFLFHIIPREHNDMLTCFSPPQSGNTQENDAVCSSLIPRYKGLMGAYLKEVGRLDQILYTQQEKSPTSTVPETTTTTDPTELTDVQSDEQAVYVEEVSQDNLDALINAINSNAELKEALIERPEEVKRMVASSEKWKRLFGSIDIDQLNLNLRAMAAARSKEIATGEDRSVDLDKISKVIK